MKILLYTPDERLGQWITKGLRESEYRVDWCREAAEAPDAFSIDDYECGILDLQRSDGTGIRVNLQQQWRDKRTPVILLTSRETTPTDPAQLLDTADDYLKKPFEFVELLAKLRALTRRRYGWSSSRITIADLELDLVKREVRRGGQRFDLTPRLYALLTLLALQAGRLVTRAEICSKLYDDDMSPVSNVVEANIRRLRHVIDRGRTPLIITHRGHGYMLADESMDGRIS